MKQVVAVFLILFGSLMTTVAQTPKEIAEMWDKTHISRLMPSDVRHSDLKKYLDELRKLGVKINEVGRSGQGREIYQMEFGRGPLKVFMWSQMHGDEPTATSSLVDMFAYFQTNKEKPWVKQIADAMTIRAVPMLNPDGAEAYKRQN